MSNRKKGSACKQPDPYRKKNPLRRVTEAPDNSGCFLLCAAALIVLTIFLI